MSILRHRLQELAIYIRLILELDFHEVEVFEGFPSVHRVALAQRLREIVLRGQECVKPVDELGAAMEQSRNKIDNTNGVDTVVASPSCL